ncbi:hemagglutinin repeat-containing protein, partial [Leeia aquatica]
FGFGQQNGFSFQIGGSKGKGLTDGSETRYDNTLITASNQLNLSSGKDTTLKGAQLAGKQVNLDVGGNLSLLTLQDRTDYQSHQSNSSWGISLCIPPI